MPGLTDHNLVAYAVQLAALIGSVGTLLWGLGVVEPRLRLTVLRATLAACVLLPFVQGATPATPVRVPGLMAMATASSAQRASSSATAAVPPPGEEAIPSRFDGLVLAIAGTGILARLAWLGLGLVGLHRVRERSPRLSPRPPAVEWAAAAVNAQAEFRTSAALDHPVSFGVRRPVVIVPAAFADLDVGAQRAVATHELVHVRERHWRHVLLEEVGRAALWFHPAVWWLVDQIHLAREQAVDREVVRLTGCRRRYLDLLVQWSSADATPPPALASAFFRRSHVKRRVALLLKEVSMSTFRRSLSLAAVVLLVGGATVAATRAVPLLAGPDRTVAATSPSSDELAPSQPAQSSGGSGAGVGVGASTGKSVAEGVATGGQVTSAAPNAVHKVLPTYPAAAAAAAVSGPVVLEVTCDTSGTPTLVQPLAGDERLAGAAVDAVSQWRFAPVDEPRTFVVGINVLPPASQDALGAKVIRIRGEMKPPKKIADVRPAYPGEAREAGVQGVVIAELTIGANGLVQDAIVQRSVKGLDAAALQAVLQWQFTQTLLNGQAVPVIMTVTVNFTLA